MSSIIFLTKAEYESKVFSSLYPEINLDKLRVVYIDDLIAMKYVNPVNNILGPVNMLLAHAKNYEKIYCSAFGGLASKLLDYYPEKVDIFLFDLLIFRVGIGKIVSPVDLAFIELEETLLTKNLESITLKHKNYKTYINHFLHEAVNVGILENSEKYNLINDEPVFLFLPGAKQFDSKDVILSETEYVNWALNNNMPSTIEKFELEKCILVDNGNDFLNLIEKLAEGRKIGGTLLAIDNKRPYKPCFDGQMLGYNDENYYKQLRECMQANANRFLGIGAPFEFINQLVATDETPLVSIVIVHRNREKLLQECLSFISNQSFKSFEVVIVDNYSNKILELSGEYEFNITIFHNMNTYPGFARNIGANLASGSYIIFFDDDNLPKVDMISELFGDLCKTGSDIVVANREYFNVKPGDDGTIIYCDPNLLHSSKLINFLGDTVFIIRKELFLSLGFSDYFRVGREDYEFINFAVSLGYTVTSSRGVLYYYRLTNTDKIGSFHITNRTTGNNQLDFGAYRRSRRSASNFAAAKLLQYNASLFAKTERQRLFGKSKRFAKLDSVIRMLFDRLPLLKRLYKIRFIRYCYSLIFSR